MNLLALLFWPIRQLHDRPLLALLPAGLFAVLAVAARREAAHRPARLWPTFAAGAWAAYAVYEARMAVWERTVAGPIRVDLLLIGPMLYAVSVAALWGWIAWRISRRT